MSNTSSGKGSFFGLLALTLATAIITGLRFLARIKSKVPLGADDYWIIASLFIMFGMIAIEGVLTYLGGTADPVGTVTAHQMELYTKSVFVGATLYPLTITATKISILLFYPRIFSVPRFLLATTIVGCRPISAAWTPASTFETAPVCINSVSLFWFSAIFLLFTDIAILCLPLSMIWRLQLSAQQKLILSGIFMLGSFVLVASILRIVYMGSDIVMAGNMAPQSHPVSSQPVTAAAGTQWAIVETQLAIICACLPMLRPILPKKGRLGRLRSLPGTHQSLQRLQADRSESAARNHLLGKPPLITTRLSDPSYLRYEISRPPPATMNGSHSQWPLKDRGDEYPTGENS
ncbi:hypothetical protein MMC30_004194 [Trapelia coarctata]|nr:hypothetical protein [Trapelia coarctata]